MDNRKSHASNLPAYFIIAYGLTWAFWFGIIIYQRTTGNEVSRLLLLFSAPGPIVAATVLSWRERGATGLKHLLGLGVKWRVAWYWYALILLLYPLVLSSLTAGIMELATAGKVPVELNLSPGLFGGFLFISAYVLIVEELGWRGYALPRLQRRYGALKSSIILGVFWGVWHLPTWILQPERSGNAPFVPAFLVFVFGTIAASVLYTFIFNSTGGSVLLVTLMHGVDNVLIGWLWLKGDTFAAPWMAVVFGLQGLIAVLVIWRYGAARLSAREKVTFTEEGVEMPHTAAVAG